MTVAVENTNKKAASLRQIMKHETRRLSGEYREKLISSGMNWLQNFLEDKNNSGRLRLF